MNLVYASSIFMLKNSLRCFANWTVTGTENVPEKGALIVVGNHLSNVDPGLLSASVPRRIRFMAKQRLFANPIAGAFFRAYGAISISGNGKEFSSIQKCLSILKKDEVIGMFPEGGRNPYGLGKAMLGAGMIAMRSGARILPVGITGTEILEHPLRVCYPTGSLNVNIGKPFTVAPSKTKNMKTNLEDITDQIMENIASLLPQEYRGVYSENWEGTRSYTSPPKFGI
jgi:1-acyl-sn-glycerol-3-phosphate acyltransferase